VLILSQPEEEKSVLDQLMAEVDRGRRILEKGDVKKGILQMWVVPLRFKLKRLLGENVPLKKFLPDVPEGLTPSEYAAILQRQLDQTTGFVTAVRDSVDRSYSTSGGKVFIGHGRSPVWREFKDFISERLYLPWDEFNRDPVAGMMTFERLSQMLSSASFAFLVMTAEDQHADERLHARENVIHEVGLFQGRLGPRKAIILLEEGCNEFSNIVGLSQLRFSTGNPSAAFENMRRVLEREGLLRT
jgi:hypothetical protein